MLLQQVNEERKMTVPKYHELYAPVLNTLKDGNVHTMKEIKQSVADQKHLTETDLAERLPSGKQAVFDNRIGWTRTYLKKAGLIESPARAQFVLTDEGKKLFLMPISLMTNI